MRIRKEIYNNKIIVDNEKVSLETDVKYKAIDIVFENQIGIERLLPVDYLIMKKNVQPSSCRVLIIKVNNNEEILSDLFKYKGKPSIVSCTIYDSSTKKHRCSIENINVTTWGNIRTEDDWWGTESSYYNDITKNDRNDYYDYYKFRKDTDRITGKKTVVKSKDKRIFNIKHKDKNINILGNLNSTNQGLRNKETKSVFFT